MLIQNLDIQNLIPKFIFLTILLFYSNFYVIAQGCECIYKKEAPKDTPFYLYKPEIEIIVLSYKQTYNTTKIIKPNGKTEFYTEPQQMPDEVNDGKFSISSVMDSVVLSNSQKEKLFTILHLYHLKNTNDCTSTTYNCYQPHHVILFYKNRQVIAF
jgi:hypothetical protein